VYTNSISLKVLGLIPKHWRQGIRRRLPEKIVSAIIARLIAPKPEPAAGDVATVEASSTDYWTEHNVTNHRRFRSIDESLGDFHWRNAQYPRYIELMPVDCADRLNVLDFGCGPGYDLVGFSTYSKPARLLGIDVSKTSLVEAAERLALHGAKCELLRYDVAVADLPVETGSIDLVHSSGVLHHLAQPDRALAEMRRVLKLGGYAQIMVYNRDSLWVHLYVAYERQLVQGIDPDLDIDAAFQRSTDGPDCPISRAYRQDEFARLAREAGFEIEAFGVAPSVFEMSLLPKRFQAIMDPRLRRESRDFLSALRFDERGLPMVGSVHAGIDGCYRLRPV
jgi:ubiquinone/menaquinone biosynthesis C-methylase UbiE